MAMINEGTIMTTMYYCLLWTDLIPEPATRYEIAWTMIGILSVAAIINISQMVIELVKSIVVMCKKISAKCKRDKLDIQEKLDDTIKKQQTRDDKLRKLRTILLTIKE